MSGKTKTHAFPKLTSVGNVEYLFGQIYPKIYQGTHEDASKKADELMD